MHRIENELYVAVTPGDDRSRVAVPESLRKCVLQSYHNSELAAHQGEKRTYLQIRDTFFWPQLRKDVNRWVRACLACRKRKTPRPLRAGLTEPALAQAPNETVAIDLVGPFGPSDKGNRWVLTMIDTFTRWPVAVRHLQVLDLRKVSASQDRLRSSARVHVSSYENSGETHGNNPCHNGRV